jgi:hypothetical protein
MVNFNSNKRIGGILPTGGYYINISLQGYKGLNNYSKDYLQIRPEFTFYQKLTSNGSVVLSDRIGGVSAWVNQLFTNRCFWVGKAICWAICNIVSRVNTWFTTTCKGGLNCLILPVTSSPGQLGLSGFYDAGRVWVDEENLTNGTRALAAALLFAGKLNYFTGVGRPL